LPVAAWYFTAGTLPASESEAFPSPAAIVQPASVVDAGTPAPADRDIREGEGKQHAVDAGQPDSADAAPNLAHEGLQPAADEESATAEAAQQPGKDSAPATGAAAAVPFAARNEDHLDISNVGDEIVITRLSRATAQVPAPAPAPATTATSTTAGSVPPHQAEAQPGNSGTATADSGMPADMTVWATADCPNELAQGSGQSDADFMEQQYGCRYLSACYVTYPPTEYPCTYYFRGLRGS
jgi:hypothetical protein